MSAERYEVLTPDDGGKLSELFAVVPPAAT
jgi:hypothetical protein